MDKITRVQIITGQILALDDRWGSVAPPRSPQSTSHTRLISDDPRWQARLSFDYEKDAAGNSWHLLELFAYGDARMTAAVRGDEVMPRYYLPGPWEQIFIPADLGDTTPLLPN